MAATFAEEFDVVATAAFIVGGGFQRVALQFPDESLKHSVSVSSALRKEILKQAESDSRAETRSVSTVRLFVLADTTFGSCCPDEVAAMHVDAQAIVHYGHACLSQATRLPVWFVFGTAPVDVTGCANCIIEFAEARKHRLLVLYGLKCIHAMRSIQQEVYAVQGEHLDITFAEGPSQDMRPSVNGEEAKQGREGQRGPAATCPNCSGLSGTCCQREAEGNPNCHDSAPESCCSANNGEIRQAMADGWSKCTADGGLEYEVGGLCWTVPKDVRMEDIVILWIGAEDPALTNIALMFNASTICRYDHQGKIVIDVASQSRFLQRRYYLIERAKDASVVGIVVGTLGVAGYREAIQKTRRTVEASGKKAYVLVMGKPNPSKLANFPECDVFVLVACPQTALLDSKEYMAPVLTPFEAEIAFLEAKTWTGAYRVGFAVDPASALNVEGPNATTSDAEPRFSFFKGGYVGNDVSQEKDVEHSTAVVLSCESEQAIEARSETPMSIINAPRLNLDLKSGAEYLAMRTFQGLNINYKGRGTASSAVIGQTGRAAGYASENSGK